MTTIKVIINNYNEFCGNCHLQKYSEVNKQFFCVGFQKFIDRGSVYQANPRLSECIIAEADYTALKEKKQNETANTR